MTPPHPPHPTAAAESFSGWSVGRRLRLLGLALLATVLCLVALLWLDARSARTETAVYQQLVQGLERPRPAQQRAYLLAVQAKHAQAQSQIRWLQAVIFLLITPTALIVLRCFFRRPDFTPKARQRSELTDDLRLALQSGAITPHFQPIIDLRSGTLVCAEALARWEHPQRGDVPPEVFIGIAEDSGQIDALTEHLLRIACCVAAQWRSSPGRPPPRLAFNLSPRQVRQDVVEMIGRVLAETGLPACQLEIEIIESAIIERPETAERLLRQLKTLGVSIALDDFGTGYSSLSHLLRFPIDKIKVDRSFVAQLNDQKQASKIVAATISLAASLEIALVAEGVENIGQMLTLYELGCREQQGWLFSKALPATEFSRWALDAPLRLDAVVRAQAEPAENFRTAA